MSSSIGTSFLGAFQASLSVLLTISYSVAAAQFKLLTESSSTDISKLCVRVFMPALLITNLGQELHADTAFRYAPILIWAILYSFSTILLGHGLRRLFKLPDWVVPAMAFNNTTSLPLLLVQSLDATGILESLLMSQSDTTLNAVQRAKSYFLVNATVGNVLTFAIGPRLLGGEDMTDKQQEESADADYQHIDDHRHAEEGQRQNGEPNGEDTNADEMTSLLPSRVENGGHATKKKASEVGNGVWNKVPDWAHLILIQLGAFLNAPMVGAMVGAIIGLAPPLHRAFFNEPQEGGIFNAWLTTSIKNIGELFAALQVVVVGTKLSSSLRKMKRGEDSGGVPLLAMMTVIVIRFVIWPIISIAVIYFIAARTSLLSDDPILWFAMMLMPTGPPALKLTALADVNGNSENEKLAIAKFLTISYAISPIISFAVVGSLKASEIAMQSL